LGSRVHLLVLRDVTSLVTVLIPHSPFPIGGPLEPSFCLYRFTRYSMVNVTQWFTWP